MVVDVGAFIRRAVRDQRGLSTNPFSLEELTFDYSRIPKEFHVSEDPTATITVYKGAPKYYETRGLFSLALHRGLARHVKEVKELIEKGDTGVIDHLILYHIGYVNYPHTPFLSTSMSPEHAQLYAPTPLIERGDIPCERNTIYKIQVHANRCLKDYRPHDQDGACGEILILGAIFPEEVEAVKIRNDDDHLDLSCIIIQEGCRKVRMDTDRPWLPAVDPNIRAVRDPMNWAYMK